MAKLNHNRPFLRYLDNIRREMAIDARRVETLSLGSVERPAPNATNDIFPLSFEEQKVVSVFFSAIEHYLDVETTLIAALAKGASKQTKLAARSVSRDKAERRLKAAALSLSARMLLSWLEGRMNLVNLYKRLESELKGDAILWDFLNDQVMKEALENINTVVESHIRGIRDS